VDTDVVQREERAMAAMKEAVDLISNAMDRISEIQEEDTRKGCTRGVE